MELEISNVLGTRDDSWSYRAKCSGQRGSKCGGARARVPGGRAAVLDGVARDGAVRKRRLHHVGREGRA